MIHDENNVLTDDELLWIMNYELVIVRDFSRMSEHVCLYIRNEFPHDLSTFDKWQTKY